MEFTVEEIPILDVYYRKWNYNGQTVDIEIWNSKSQATNKLNVDSYSISYCAGTIPRSNLLHKSHVHRLHA